MKKEKKKEIFPWKKVFVIAVGVVFIAMMVLSAMGMSWLQSFRTVMANDTVTIGFTLRDAAGQPVLTSDQSLYQTAYVGQLQPDGQFKILWQSKGPLMPEPYDSLSFPGKTCTIPQQSASK